MQARNSSARYPGRKITRFMMSEDLHASIKAKCRRGRKVSKIVRDALAFGLDNPELLPGDPPGPHSRVVVVLVPEDLLAAVRAHPAFYESKRPGLWIFARRCLAFYVAEVI